MTEKRSHSDKSYPVFPNHDFYKQGDEDAPDQIKDQNGDIVLTMCRRCGRAEGQLSGTDKVLCRPIAGDVLPYPPQFPKGSLLVSSIASDLAKLPRLHDNDYPLWQGPCGPGWNGGITQSMLVNFLSCRERYRLKYILGLVPPDKWHHTWGYGNMWHICEEALSADPRLAMINEHMDSYLSTLYTYVRELFNQYPMQREEITKWANVCAVQFPEYVRYWEQHPDVQSRTPLLQEQPFDVPYTLPSGRVVRLRGKWDSVDSIPAHTDDQGKQWPDGIWLQENKTKGDIDEVQVERQLSFDLQTMLYLIALRTYFIQQAAIAAKVPHDERPWDDCPILGVRYNVVRRPLSGGKGNIKPHQAKATKSKYIPAETMEHYYERLRRDYIAKEPSYWFFRIRAGISAQDIQVFKDTCLDPLLEQVCEWYDQVTGSKFRALYQIPLNYRTPFGVYSALEEGGATEYDHYLATGSEATLRRTEELFTELK